MNNVSEIYEWQMGQTLERFQPTSLRQMDEVALLNRTDTKYVMSVETLLQVLETLHDAYRVLAIGRQRKHRYRTLYFDTADFDLYQRHHAGRLNRYKVRSREYVDSESAFLEVKFKSNKRRTIKSRIQTDEIVTDLAHRCDGQDATNFLTGTYPNSADSLQPQLWNRFERVTLASKRQRERLTLDFGLEFQWQGRKKKIANVVVAEVKQEGFSHDSAFIKEMRRSSVRPASFSKYCMGVSYLYPEVKHNNFKRNLLLISKLGGNHAC